MGRVRLVPALAFASLAFLGLFLGAFSADPMRAIVEAQWMRLRAAGAHEERFRANDGAFLRVVELGPLSAKTPVVLLHGLGATAEYWTGTALALSRAGRTVLLLDAPGSGGSEPPRALSGYTLAARVQAVGAMAHALGLEKMDLVGHSLGGWTAGLYALGEPRRIEHLVLVDSGGFTPVANDDVETAKRRLTPQTREGSRRLVDLLFFRKPFPLAGVTLDAFRRTYRAENVTATLDQLSASDGLLGRERLLPPGTALVWGARETLFPLEDARRAVARIPGGRLFVLSGVGHDGPLEAPEAFQEALLTALGGR